MKRFFELKKTILERLEALLILERTACDIENPANPMAISPQMKTVGEAMSAVEVSKDPFDLIQALQNYGIVQPKFAKSDVKTLLIACTCLYKAQTALFPSGVSEKITHAGRCFRCQKRWLHMLDGRFIWIQG